MDVQDPLWDRYEQRFMALANTVELSKGPLPLVSSARLMLCLYGENGLTPDQEFALLDTLEANQKTLQGTTMTTAYWEDIILFTL
jgi:hypothetical protein